MTIILLIFVVATLVGVWLALRGYPRASGGWKGLVELLLLLEIGFLLLTCTVVWMYHAGIGVYSSEVTDSWKGGKDQWLLVRAAVPQDVYLSDEEHGYAVHFRFDPKGKCIEGGFSHDDEIFVTPDGTPVKFELPFIAEADWNWSEENGYLYLKPGDEVVVGAKFRPLKDETGKPVFISTSTWFVFRGTPDEFKESECRRQGLRKRLMLYLTLLFGVAASVLLSVLLKRSPAPRPDAAE